MLGHTLTSYSNEGYFIYIMRLNIISKQLYICICFTYTQHQIFTKFIQREDNLQLLGMT